MIKGLIPFSAASLTTPTNGARVIADHWWVIDAEGRALMSRTFGTPQCNAQKAILERFYPDCEHRFLPVAYFDADMAKRGAA